MTLKEGGGVKLSYLVSGADLPFDTQISVYWSSTPDLDGRLGDAAAMYQITTADQKHQDDTTPKTFLLTHSQFVVGHQAPADGAKYLVVVADPSLPGSAVFGTIPELREDNNIGAIRIDPFVLNVVTHGFNPYPLTSVSWPYFRAQWYTLGKQLETVATPGSGAILEGRIKSYVAEWDSRTGFADGVFSLLFAKLDDGASKLFQRLHRPTIAAQFTRRAKELRKQIPSYIATSTQYAENAAKTIFQDIATKDEYGLKDPDPSPNLLPLPPGEERPLPRIELIGHSRGAAVNARVSRLLSVARYQVDQYTSLDGYSTDWPTGGGDLGDISITGETVATRKVNYRVEDGLEKVVLAGLSTLRSIKLKTPDILATLGTIPFLAGASLSPLPEDIRLMKTLMQAVRPQRNWAMYYNIVDGANDLRAPKRFAENPSLGPGSNHLNAFDYYHDSHAFFDNYAGNHRSDV